ncbi:BcsE family c-di-GMP-binding protein [Escherichia coli]
MQPRSDEKRILSNVAVLEGAPPLSEHWQLFNNNEVLFNEARTAQAATVVFFFTAKCANRATGPAAFIPCVASAVVR